jgi:N-acetylneuraminate synthase
MTDSFQIADRTISRESPAFVIAEAGINHNGSLETALQIVNAASVAGADAIKFQKRDPLLCVPKDQWDVERDTPWGRMRYIDYKLKMEFGAEEFAAIAKRCDDLGIIWFASPWDVPSVEFLVDAGSPALKIASASLTDRDLRKAIVATRLPVIVSSGMSTLDEVDEAVGALTDESVDFALLHCTSSYPTPIREINLSVIRTYLERYSVPIGYSGHEVGLQTTVAAVALGAKVIERHITLDRAMWGTDHAASIEPEGFRRLVRDIRAVETALGDGEKCLYDSELGPRQKLRG